MRFPAHLTSSLGAIVKWIWYAGTFDWSCYCSEPVSCIGAQTILLPTRSDRQNGTNHPAWWQRPKSSANGCAQNFNSNFKFGLFQTDLLCVVACCLIACVACELSTLLLLWSISCVSRTLCWRDEVTLWQWCVACNTASTLLHHLKLCLSFMYMLQELAETHQLLPPMHTRSQRETYAAVLALYYSAAWRVTLAAASRLQLKSISATSWSKWSSCAASNSLLSSTSSKMSTSLVLQ
jgi:hypothetical protein